MLLAAQQYPGAAGAGRVTDCMDQTWNWRMRLDRRLEGVRKMTGQRHRRKRRASPQRPCGPATRDRLRFGCLAFFLGFGTHSTGRDSDQDGETARRSDQQQAEQRGQAPHERAATTRWSRPAARREPWARASPAQGGNQSLFPVLPHGPRYARIVFILRRTKSVLARPSGAGRLPRNSPDLIQHYNECAQSQPGFARSGALGRFRRPATACIV
jgi:hypothetical protein